MLDYIVWNANPVLIDSFITVRWYGLMFAIGFWIGFNIVAKMFKHEGAPERWLGILLIWVGAGTVIGARLGHVFFYAWDYYSQHPWKILATWEGGLASHGDDHSDRTAVAGEAAFPGCEDLPGVL